MSNITKPTFLVFLSRLSGLLPGRRVRRAMDATTGAVLVGFSVKLATEHA